MKSLIVAFSLLMCACSSNSIPTHLNEKIVTDYQGCAFLVQNSFSGLNLVYLKDVSKRTCNYSMDGYTTVSFVDNLSRKFG